MSELSKHTPRPWYALGGTVYPEREGLDMLIAIAKCPARRGTISKAEAAANAHLIAAAPDLLEALRGMVEAWHEPLDDEPARVAAAEAAIAKAEGRSDD